MHTSHRLELDPGHTVTQLLFKRVRNAAELRQSAVAGNIHAALINPTMVGRGLTVCVCVCVCVCVVCTSFTH